MSPGRPKSRTKCEIEKKLIEDKLIKYVREENSLFIAKRFINEYPDSRYLKNVTHIRNYLEFRKAEKANNINNFQDFITNYPDAAQVPIAAKYIEQLSFEKVKNSSKIEDLNKFINDFPDSEYNYQATKFRDLLAFNIAKLENTIEAYNDFILNYPNAIQVTEAKQIKMKLVFEKAKSINTLEAYNEFVEMYPEGEHYIDIFNLKANVLGGNIQKNNKHEFTGIKWIKSFDNKGFNDAVYDFVIDKNNEILILGTTKTSLDNNNDIWFLKLDEWGKMKWNRSMGDTLNEKLYSADLLDEDHFVAVGKNKFNDTIAGNSWIVGAQIDGSKAWNKNLGSSMLNTVIRLNENEFIVGGNYFSSDSINKCYLAKIRNDGKTIWQRYYTMKGEINDLNITDSSDVIVAGSNYLMSINKSGYINWEKAYSDTTVIENACISSDGIYFTESITNGEVFLSKSDIDGNIIWRQIIHGDNISATDLAISSENQLIVSFINNNDVQLSWYANNGDKLKDEFFGTDKNEKNCSIGFADPNSLLILITIEYRENDSDILIINKSL